MLPVTNHSHPSRKHHEALSRFNYYTSSVLANHQSQPSPHPKWKCEHYVADIGPARYHLLRDRRDALAHCEHISRNIIKQKAEDVYGKTEEASRGKQGKETVKELNQDVQIVLIGQDPIQKSNGIPSFTSLDSLDEQQMSRSTYSSRAHKSRSRISSSISLGRQGQYDLYIIHKSNSSQWLYFVERIRVGADNHHHFEPDHASFHYEAVIGLPTSTSLAQSLLSWVVASPQQSLLQQAAFNCNNRLNVLESGLSRKLSQTHLAQVEEEKHAHLDFRREDKLPPGQYKKFERLRNFTYGAFAELNPQRKRNRYFLDNLVCRFLKFKEYAEEPTRQALRNYLEWWTRMRNKYTYDSFKHYNAKNLYSHVGNDYKGRPVIYFRCSLVIQDEITNEDEYIDYTFYMLEMYIQDITEGYVDEFILVSDYEDFGTRNFKIAQARKIADTARDLFPDTQYKIVAYGLSNFAYGMYKIIKHFLPSFLMQKVAIFGKDRKELKQFFDTLLDTRILPEQVFKGTPYASNEPTPRLPLSHTPQ